MGVRTAGLLLESSMNANVHRMCFWLVAHTIYEPSLMSTIRNEIGPAIKGGKLDINPLVEDQNCPMLNAAFNETLRYTSAAASGRVVLSPTNIGGKTLYPGAKVYMPYRQSHFSDEVFGSNILEFDPQRFVSNKGMAKNPAYRPFGGGSQHCSGRFLARREVIGFLAFILHQFDISLSNMRRDGTPESGAPQFPRTDISKQNIGVISPVRGDDIILSIKPRKKDSL